MHARRHHVARPWRSPVAGAVVLAAALALVACGCDASADIAIPRPTGPLVAPSAGSAPGGTGASTGAPATARPSVPAGSDVCVPGLWATIKDHIANDAVSLVGLSDGCRTATIETTLDPSSGAVGVAICTAAAEVAWAGGVQAIRVTAADTSVLATAEAGAPCARAS